MTGTRKQLIVEGSDESADASLISHVRGVSGFV